MKSIITEIKRLNEAATKAPWSAIPSHLSAGIHPRPAILTALDGPGRREEFIHADFASPANAELTAFYRNNAPKLADAYEKLMEVAERMEEAMQSAKEDIELGDDQSFFKRVEEALAAFNAIKSQG